MSSDAKAGTQPDSPVSIGDDHKTHAWGKWRPVGFMTADSQQRECVICNFAERVPIHRSHR